MSTNNHTTKKIYLDHIISYITLRRAVGILGASLPFILLIGAALVYEDKIIQPSISDYYHTKMRDVFVGILCAIGLFLFSYTGYDRNDNIAGNFACLAVIGIIFCPTSANDAVTPAHIIHIVFAGSFFLIIAYFSLFLFTKSDTNSPTTQKLCRNKLYRVCGYVIIVAISIIGIYFILLEKLYPVLSKYNPVFWLETIALLAFGLSWMTKGNALLRDSQE